ncbi:MAG: sodium:solute symporter [Gammaproteobacteria bacterium]|nr:sodium:solute symporter [Gammaproteobacteria bacterium]NIR85132.1 sodium:solute symporter [Gammaproteobacteria bacterium]NIR92061.1 sodium:solute symporter [Gammaproteobacteria bacterium]NIU06181.1 sodium:solute symporter [Gammaproteobacteria bacterium]NIV53180.1 sodium:solute symporter family protein [Gammaproteobacteria bacterium]
MDAKIVWLFVFVILYWAYCIFWGIRGAIMARTASDYFIAGRRLSLWVFVLAATATSFSGWTFMGHPGLLYRDGFQYAYASFYAITIPFTGVMFLKRQWMLGKRFGFVTPGEMLSHYFRGDAIRLLVVIVALVFSVPYLGLQLRASGFLFNVLTDGLLGVNVGMWLLSAVVFIYVASGGLRAVAYVDTLQCVLLALGIIGIGIIAISYVGGIGQLSEGMAALALFDQKTTPDGYSHYVAIPGVIQWVSSGPSAEGGAWTGIMILTYMFALMGIQSAPAFSMWSFSNTDPRPFAPQQVWASSFGIGLILFVFTAFQGMGGHLLGADTAFTEAHPELVNPVLQEGLQGKDLMESAGKQGMLVPQLIRLMADGAPWLVGLLSVCALAAMQSTGAAYMSTAGGMLTRDLLKHFLMPNASHIQQKLFGRLGVLLIVLAALVVATTSSDALVLLGGLAVAYGFQMWPALIAVCWWPWLTRQGVTWGLLVGLVAVTCTETIGQNLGITAWGRWPLTIHSAGWGILFNLGLAIIISAMTQNDADAQHRMKFHNFLREHATLPEAKKSLVPVAWIITLVWFFFGIGPGAVIGNTIFGNPNDISTWTFGIPSIWAWQILWWALGVFMMWFLAYKMELSTVPEREIEALYEDIGDVREDVRTGV